MGYTGSRCLVHRSGEHYQVYTYQTITGLANGLYTLKAMVKNDFGGLGNSYMEAADYGGGKKMKHKIPKTSEWVEITITDINVTNGQCTIGFHSKSSSNRWYFVDDVAFYKQ